MGSDSAVSSTNLRSSPFQSTLPGWGATVGWSLMVVTCMDFNPRSPDGERLAHRLSNVSLMTLFQSTLPGWGATKDGTRHPCPPPISIHAPRMGSDCSPGAIVVAMSEFQSTLPGWGATHVASESRGRRFDFNPRSPDGERRFDAHDGAHEGGISIHAPRMGSDRPRLRAPAAICGYFNPRSPDGERPCPTASSSPRAYFNPRSPDGERPTITGISKAKIIHFNPRSPDGERLPVARNLRVHRFDFNPRSPDGERPLPSTRVTVTSANFNPRSPDGERPRKWTSSPTIWAKSSIFNTDCIADRR